MYFGLLLVLKQVGVAESEKRVAAIFLLPVLGSRAPETLLSEFLFGGGSTPIWGLGARAPKMDFFFIFYFTKNPQNEFSLKFVSRQVYESALIAEILKKNLSSRFRENGVQIWIW